MLVLLNDYYIPLGGAEWVFGRVRSRACVNVHFVTWQAAADAPFSLARVGNAHWTVLE
jgi:hypothetical protein